MGKKFKTIFDLDRLREEKKKKEQEMANKWDTVDQITPASVLKKEVNGTPSKSMNDSTHTVSSQGSETKLTSKKKKKNKKQNRYSLPPVASKVVTSVKPSSNNIFLEVMHETRESAKDLVDLTKKLEDFEQRKRKRALSDSSKPNGSPTKKIVPAKKRVITSDDDEPRKENGVESAPYIVESPHSSDDEDNTGLNGSNVFSYTRVSASIADEEEDEDEESGITLTEESEDDEDLDEDYDDLAGFIDDEVEEEALDDEDEELFEEDEEERMSVDEQESDEGDLGEHLVKLHEKRQEESNDLETLTIEGYTIDYANFRQGCLVLQKNKKIASLGSRFALYEFSKSTNHSVQVALEAFRWMIAPFDTQLFFRDVFQKTALVIKRGSPKFYDGLFNTDSLTKMLQNHFLEYGINLNVAKYENGVRTTLNGTGRAYVGDISKRYHEGCSIQVTNPQAFNDEIWYLCEILQELFCSFIGANTYLTPPGSAGFAPHWDDIDAFIIQTEGRKHWKIFAPRNLMEALPLESSGNFTEEEMIGRKLVFNDWLEQGDLLYIPRGFIHQACTDEKIHSHHVTVSVNRQFAFINMLEKILPTFLEMVATNHKEFRFSLPPNVFDMSGIVDLNYDNEEAYENKMVSKVKTLAKYMQKDLIEVTESGIDQMAADFMKTALPPLLTPDERAMSAMNKPGLNLLTDTPTKITLNSDVRFIRKHGQRLIFEDEGEYYLAHRMANSRVYEGRPEQTIPINEDQVAAYISLMDAYPEFIKVKDLECSSKKKNIEFAEMLYSNGLLLLKAFEKDTLPRASGEEQISPNKIHEPKTPKETRESPKKMPETETKLSSPKNADPQQNGAVKKHRKNKKKNKQRHH